MTWGVVYCQEASGRVPAEDFLNSCPAEIDATFNAVMEAVRAAPPPAFSGGGKWEAMHGVMAGYYEIRLTGPGRRHYRLFCLLDNGSPEQLAERGYSEPQIVEINGQPRGWSELRVSVNPHPGPPDCSLGRPQTIRTGPDSNPATCSHRP